MKKILGVMALLVVFCSPVYAATMTFDSFTTLVSPFPFPYTEDGITMSVSAISNPGATYSAASSGVFHEDGYTIRFDMGGSLFNLDQINFPLVGAPDADLILKNNSGGTITLGPFSGSVGVLDFTGYPQLSGILYFDIWAVSPGTTDPVSACVIFDSIQTSVSGGPVPEPSTLFLLGSGLVGLVGYGRRHMKK